MNNSELTKLINTNLKHRLPVYKAQFSEHSDNNFILANVGSFRWFSKFTTSSRSKLGINEAYMRALHENKKRVIVKMNDDYMPYDLSEIGLELLNKQTDEIRIYYNFASNWAVSIRLAILTNFLFLPPQNKPIVFSKDGSPKDYPAIYFTENVSIYQLKQFIQAKAQEIRHITTQMPNPKKHKAELHTILWGQVVSMLIGNVNVYLTDNFFAEIHRKLDKEIFKNITVPDKIELRNQYKRFLEYSISLGQTPVLYVKFPSETKVRQSSV